MIVTYRDEGVAKTPFNKQYFVFLGSRSRLPKKTMDLFPCELPAHNKRE